MSLGSKPKPQVQSAKTSSAPWAPQGVELQHLFKGARERYDSSDPRYFPDDTYVPYSDESEYGLDAMTRQALRGDSVGGKAAEYGGDVLSGKYLNSNQYIDETFDYAADAVTRNYNKVRNPNIDTLFSKAGRYGSDAWKDVRSDSDDTLARNLTGMADTMYGKNFESRMADIQETMLSAGKVDEAGYADANKMFQVGGLKEGKSMEELSGQIDRYNFGQNIEDQKLQDYGQLISGTYGGEGTSSGQLTPSYSKGSGIGEAVGLGLQAASMAGMT